MPTWHAQVEIPIDVDENQLGQYLGESDSMAYNTSEKIMRLGTWIDAADFDAAVTGARVWVSQLRAAREAVPQRLTVESQDAQISTWAVGAKEAAERLGLSKSRLFQLADSPGFPAPVPGVEAGTAKIFRVDELDEYGRNRNLQPGRPRKAAATEG
ncbi:AlpA family transcriptional regulator [Actinoplanes sp. N902-109]|uniref:helix-turn-helix transcriptional regulator n=1 Tax=Actinoplanes sp. (strain N902-109) TaxID=649831 RepID=UPI0003293D89|nr:hypothetical protein [Actinoplanes sp. N902-109]AGL19482.1 hypothetical protein L083_5972 [Actinoplanes sp. N902-109]